MKVIRHLGVSLTLVLAAQSLGCDGETDVVMPDETADVTPGEAEALDKEYEDAMNKQAEQVEASQGG
ncbi:MAG: hypothetical protein AAF664_23835 [Planctomycetota bacterium]